VRNETSTGQRHKKRDRENLSEKFSLEDLYVNGKISL
jgi:hypothetical protein